MLYLTPTHLNYYRVCPRKLWLFGNGIGMEHSSELVYEGKQLHETAYPQRAGRYTEMAFATDIRLPDGREVCVNAKIDFFEQNTQTVCEVKKSDKMEPAHLLQLKFYLYLLLKNGVEAQGRLEYPKLKKTTEVRLEDGEEAEVENAIAGALATVSAEFCPQRIDKGRCKNCSYFDFCYAE